MEPTKENDDAKMKELFLDTKGSCFLCLKETENSNGTTNLSTMKETCVRTICKYLNINPTLILLKSLKDRDLTTEERKEATSQRNQCDFSVLLCVQCSTLAAQITKLVQELEMAKMTMNLKLQQFHKILTTSEQEAEDGQDQPRWEKLKEKMMTSENPVEARLVETLRDQAKQKCSQQLKELLAASYPKVSLKRFRTNPKVAEPPPPPPPPPISSKDPGPSQNEVPTASSPSSLNAPSNSDNTDANDALHKQRILTISSRHYQSLPSGTQYKCLLCHNTFVRQNNRFPQHVIRVHPEEIFTHPNFQKLGKKQLWKLTTRVLYAESKSSQQKVATVGPSLKNPWYQCALCACRYRRGNELKYHLALNHFSYVEKQMLQAVNLKQNKTRSVASSSAPPKRSADAHFVCDALRLHDCPKGTFKKPSPDKSATLSPQKTVANSKSIPEICAKYTVAGSGGNQFNYHCGICKSSEKGHPKLVISKHLVNVHPEVFFAHVKDETVSKERFKILCRNVLMDTSTYTRVPSGGTGRAHCLCSFCRLRHRDAYRLRYHLMMEHRDILDRMVGRAMREDSVGMQGKPGSSTMCGEERSFMSCTVTEMEIDTQEEVFGGEPSLEYEMKIVEESEAKPVIAEQIVCEIDMSDFPTTMDEDVHSEFQFHGTMTGLNGPRNEQQSKEINGDIKTGIDHLSDFTEQTILPHL